MTEETLVGLRSPLCRWGHGAATAEGAPPGCHIHRDATPRWSWSQRSGVWLPVLFDKGREGARTLPRDPPWGSACRQGCGQQSEVAQSCPTLWDFMGCSLPGSSIHEIFQARVLEWVAISFSRGTSQPRDQTGASYVAGRHFTIWATTEGLGQKKGKKQGDQKEKAVWEGGAGTGCR